DCIPTIFSVAGDGDRLALGIADDEGTGGVEGDADHVFRSGAGLVHGGMDGRAYGGPDLFAVMLGEIGVGAPHENGILIAAQEFTVMREYAGPGAARAYVHSHEEVLRHATLSVLVPGGPYWS